MASDGGLSSDPRRELVRLGSTAAAAAILLIAAVLVIVPAHWRGFAASVVTFVGTALTLIPVLHVSWYGLQANRWEPDPKAQPGVRDLLAVPQAFFKEAAVRLRSWHFYLVLSGLVGISIGAFLDLVNAIPG